MNQKSFQLNATVFLIMLLHDLHNTNAQQLNFSLSFKYIHSINRSNTAVIHSIWNYD